LLRRTAQVAAGLGVEVFVLDLGWSRKIGDWRADPSKFPSGLRALSDHVHSLGMRFGVHFALAEAMEDSPVLQEHPDWASTRSYGYYDAKSLCLSHEPAREWLIAEAVRMIDEYGVDWIVQDGENMVKLCLKGGHTHDAGDSNYSNAVLGLNYVVAEIQRRRPSVLWENCEDGGNMMTYNMVRRYVTSINCDNDKPLTTRRAAYGATFPFPSRYTDRYMENLELDTYVTRSFMYGGGPWIFMNKLTEMGAPSAELAKREVALFKSLRKHLRDGRIYHLAAPGEQRYDALQSLDTTSGTSIVFITKEEGAVPEDFRVRLKGLDEQTEYECSFQDLHAHWTMDGAALMSQGVRLNLPGNRAADILYVRPRRDSGALSDELTP
jgi:alpha-galactosidase